MQFLLAGLKSWYKLTTYELANLGKKVAFQIMIEERAKKVKFDKYIRTKISINLKKKLT